MNRTNKRGKTEGISRDHIVVMDRDDHVLYGFRYWEPDWTPTDKLAPDSMVHVAKVPMEVYLVYLELRFPRSPAVQAFGSAIAVLTGKSQQIPATTTVEMFRAVEDEITLTKEDLKRLEAITKTYESKQSI